MSDQHFTNPEAPTLAATYDATISASTAVTFNSGTTYIVVSAIDKGVFMKWGGTVSSSDFDEFIAVGETRIFAIQATSAEFIQEAATGKVVVIEK